MCIRDRIIAVHRRPLTDEEEGKAGERFIVPAPLNNQSPQANHCGFPGSLPSSLPVSYTHLLGFNIEATSGTAKLLKAHGIKTREKKKISEGSEEILDSIRKGHVTYILNTLSSNDSVSYTHLDVYKRQERSPGQVRGSGRKTAGGEE